jgi:hypothetical protein
MSTVSAGAARKQRVWLHCLRWLDVRRESLFGAGECQDDKCLSYERHLNGEMTVYNLLDVSRQPIAATPVSISMGHGGGIAEEIAKLNNLKEQGVLSVTQFEVAKAKVLGA